MDQNGKPPTGRRHLPQPQEEDPFENLPKLPPPPVNVRPAKLSTLALADRSLLSASFRHIRPSWRAYIHYVDLAARKGDKAMERFLKAYESLTPQDRRTVWPEQICDLANVDPGELYGAVCRQLWETKALESSTISSIQHPELLLATIRLAKKPENYRDRELCFRMMGSLPDKKGASINIFNTAAAQTAEVSLPDRAKLRSFDEEVIEMSRDLETDVPFLVKSDPDVSS